MRLEDIGAREVAVFLALALAIIWLGLYPQPVLNTSRTAITGIGDTYKRSMSPSPGTVEAAYREVSPTPGQTKAAPVSRDPGVRVRGEAP